MWRMGGANFFLRVLLSLGMIGLFSSTMRATAAQTSPKLADIIDKAAKEGEIVYQAPDPDTGLPTGEFLRDMSALTEKHFGVKIRVKIDNSLNFPASTAKVLTELKSAAPPSYDLMFQNLVSGLPLFENKAIEPTPWLELLPQLTPKDLTWSGLVPVVDTQFVMPSYNTRLVKAQDVPKSWDDLLNPKWKGKLGVLVNHEPWTMLSQPNAWGEEKTLAYLKKLMELRPKLGRFPESHQKVLSGETPLAWAALRERTLYYRDQRGAPMGVAEEVEPALVWVYVLVVPKGARNQNAATLMTVALMTKEGQELHYKYRYSTSMFRPGTPAAQFAAKHRVLLPDLDFLLKKGYGDLIKKIRSILLEK